MLVDEILLLLYRDYQWFSPGTWTVGVGKEASLSEAVGKLIANNLAQYSEKHPDWDLRGFLDKVTEECSEY